MKKTCMLLLLALVLAPVCAQAAAPVDPQLKIGIVDIQKVLAESKTVQSYREKVGREIESKQKLLSDKQKAAAQIEERLRNTQNEKEQRSLQDSLSAALRDLQRMKEDLEGEVKKTDRDLTQKMLKEIDEILKQIYEKENYTVIFEKNAAGVLRFRSSVDLTDRVIKAYDKK